MGWWVLDFLLPSLWEAEVTVSAALLLIAAILLVLDQSTSDTTSSSPSSSDSQRGDRQTCAQGEANGKAVLELQGSCKSTSLPAGSSQETNYVIKLELLSAKYLIGANLSGTSDPYAIISCGEQKRFSSMVPSSRKPLWGEEFNFLVSELPVEITITIYDWDVGCKCKLLGSVTVAVLREEKTGAIWYDLDSKSGQICLRVSSTKQFFTSDSFFVDYAGLESPRKMILNGQPLALTQDNGPLQAIFKLPQEEIIHHSYSCALERSFLYHGCMYISAWHLYFHSNVFSKQLKVIVPLQDIDMIKRSQHSLINPAITIFLHTGAEGHGAPPLCSRNGRVRYKFTSFWNRNRTFRALETALKNYQATLEAEKQVRVHSLLNAGSNKVVTSKPDDKMTAKENMEQIRTYEAFINENVLVDVTNNTFPSTAENFFGIILGENSKFFQDYRYTRKDTDLKLTKWYTSDEYGGQVREVTFRSLCHSPLCPPDTAVTEWQHASFSDGGRNLVYETKQQAHDVPFGSYFEIHSRWSLRTMSRTTCQVDIKIGVNMKKWCILQSKIKSGATDEYRREVCKILEAARDYILNRVQ